MPSEKFLEILFYAIDCVKKICYICGEVIGMAKPNIAGKLKNLARELKEEENSGVKKSGDGKQGEVRRKQSTDGGKESGRKS